MKPPEGPGGTVAVALATSSALLLFASAFGPWPSHGTGSTLSGHALGDLLLRGTISPWAPRWAGLVLYVVPLCGAVSLLAIAVGGRIGRWISMVTLGSALIAEVAVSAALHWVPMRSPGWGAFVSQVGLAAGLAGPVAARLAPYRSQEAFEGDVA